MINSISFEQKRQLPRVSAIYFVLDSCEGILYVGETQSLFFRFLSHSHNLHFKKWKASAIKWMCAQELTSKNRKHLERALIKKLLPPLNKQCHPGFHANPPAHRQALCGEVGVSRTYWYDLEKETLKGTLSIENLQAIEKSLDVSFGVKFDE